MTGVILFRAQPFHNGHLHMVKQAIKDCQEIGTELHVIIGSADKSGTKRNPIPVEERIDLVKNSIADAVTESEFKKIHIWQLPDLSDEANNTHSWGRYLYHEIISRAGDDNMIFFYSDKPEIVLSWFDTYHRNHIAFKFVERHNSFNATDVRIHIKYNDVSELKRELPPYVFQNLDRIRPYIENAK